MSKAAPKSAPKPKPKSKSAVPHDGRHGGKHAPRTRPTLPQHELPAPYNRLLTLGSVDYEQAEEVYKQIAAGLSQANAQEAVARLTAMALDASYGEYFDEKRPIDNDPRLWTRLHAVSVLSLMGQTAQAAIDPLLVLLNEEDDDLREELPLFYAAMGEAAVEPLRRVLQNPDADTYMRTGAGDSLTQIGEAHADLRPTIVPLLEQSLVNAGGDDLLASFLVCNLLDLDAKESLPFIQQAFAEDRVDTDVVEIRDVEEHFGLPSAAPERRSRRDTDADMPTYSAPAPGDAAVEGLANEEAAATSSPFVKMVKLGRNEPCWCGSGKKYKQCHGGG